MAAYRSGLAAFVATVLAYATVGFAQTERLNPNPLQPSGVGSGSDVDRGRGGGGAQMGRSLGPGDENPADTLLRELGGTNANRRTGKFMFGDPQRQNSGYRGIKPKMEDGVLRFDRRGAYEEAIYGSRRGSYTMNMTRKSNRRAP